METRWTYIAFPSGSLCSLFILLHGMCFIVNLIRFLRDLSTLLISSHFSIHSLWPSFQTKQQGFLCYAVILPLLISCENTLWPSPFSPSAALLIKDSDTTTKFGASSYHHRAERTCIMFVCLFVFQLVLAVKSFFIIITSCFHSWTHTRDTFIHL